MDHLDFLRDIAAILAVAIVVVAAFQKIKIPSIAGFIFAGILIGPHALSLVNDPGQVAVLAEMGVVLLLYGIGLEIPLSKLRQLWRQALPAGLIQVALTILFSYLSARIFDLASGAAIFVGFLITVSSTAIVLKGLESRGDLDSPHGRLSLGILLFQDFSVVPMILIIPALRAIENSASVIIADIFRACAILLIIIGAAYIFVPRLLKFVAELRQRHLFILTVLLITIGTAWLVSLAGISLAIGAFLAGLVVARGEYRHQALSDIIPLKEAFASLFFVSIGMLLDLRAVFDGILAILSLFTTIMAGKFLVVILITLILRLPMRVGLLTGMALAQMGEFSFVLLSAGRESDLLPASIENKLMAAAVLTMLATPFMISWGPRLAAGAIRIKALTKPFRILEERDDSESQVRLEDHVIIGGYGFAGKVLSSTLKQCGIRYVVVDINPGNIRQAAKDGHAAFYGDVSSPDVLESLDIATARELVFVINDPTAVERAISHARRLAAKLHIVVRTRYLLDIEPLKKAGADDIIPAERESAAKTAEIVLKQYCLPDEIIKEGSEKIRKSVE